MAEQVEALVSVVRTLYPKPFNTGGFGIIRVRDIRENEEFSIKINKVPDWFEPGEDRILLVKGREYVHEKFGKGLENCVISRPNEQVLEEIDAHLKSVADERTEEIRKDAVRRFLKGFRGIGEAYSREIVENVPIDVLFGALESGDIDMMRKSGAARVPERALKSLVSEYAGITQNALGRANMLMKLWMASGKTSLPREALIYVLLNRAQGIVKHLSEHAEQVFQQDWDFASDPEKIRKGILDLARFLDQDNGDTARSRYSDSSNGISSLLEDVSNTLIVNAFSSLAKRIAGRTGRRVDEVHDDISNKVLDRFFEHVDEQIRRVVEERPLRLFNWMKVAGMLYKERNRAAVALGYMSDDPVLVQHAIVHQMNSNYSNGSVGMSHAALIGSVSRNFSVPELLVEKTVQDMVDTGDLIRDDNIVYTFNGWMIETIIARNLECVALDEKTERLDEQKALATVDELMENAFTVPIELSDEQKQGVVNALTSNVSILTGGPGCGKTFTVNVIIKALERQGFSAFVVTPTGKAANRAREVCLSQNPNVEISTIHRFLSIQPQGESDAFAQQVIDLDALRLNTAVSITPDEDEEKNDKTPEGPVAVIVDEMSMVDVSIMQMLTSALANYSHPVKLVMVGDVDQLPSVGPGNVLKDMIDSGVVPTTMLTKVYRQADQSPIVHNAHRINQGKIPENMGDFELTFINDEKKTVKKVVESVKSVFDGGDVISDFPMVLAPAKKGDYGVNALNDALKKVFNPTPPKTLHFHKGRMIDEERVEMLPKSEKEQVKSFSIGDRVINIKNRYDRVSKRMIVANGDIGMVTGMGYGKGGGIEIVVTFPDPVIRNKRFEVRYTEDEVLEYLDQAWAMTVHKSQGSESPHVVFVSGMQHGAFAYRKIPYTAVTRAKESCDFIFCGGEQDLSKFLSRKDDNVRITNLGSKLEAHFLQEQNNQVLTSSPR